MRATALCLLVLLAPATASAQALSQVAGLFNIMVGLMLVFAFMFFFGGLGMWFTRLHTSPTHRDEAIRLMEWGVAVLFVLAVLLAVVQFVQTHTALASLILGIAIVIGVVILFLKVSQTQGEGDDKGH